LDPAVPTYNVATGDNVRDTGLLTFRGSWIALAIFGLPESASITWANLAGEPQSGGLGNVHTHFAVFALGGLSAVGLAVWLVPGLIYSCFGWRKLRWFDFGMLFLSACVAAVVLHPGWVF
jgi:hypothetical protein